MKKLVAVAALALACACAREAEAPKEEPKRKPGARTVEEVFAPKPPDDAYERENLLNLAYGSGVISRTAEATLDFSAALAIDGDPQTQWAAPQGDPVQSIVYALPARSRLTQIGAETKGRHSAVHALRFEASTDGRTFRPLKEAQLEHRGGLQLFPIDATEATHLRVSTLAGGYASMLVGVHARGEQLAQVRQPSIAGTWRVNGKTARFTQTGAHARGTLETDGPTILLAGGTDGRLFRFVWTRGPQYGVATITLSPDGQHLTGIYWYEEPIVYYYGASWFGERTGDTAPAAGLAPYETYLQRFGKVPLYDLRFDNDALVETDSSIALGFLATQIETRGNVRIVAREYREANAQANKAKTQARLDSLRAVLAKRGVDVSKITFVSAGQEGAPHEPTTELMRALYGTISLEIR